MTPQTFIEKWGPGGPAFALNEEQGAQSHFLDLCELLGVPKPGSEAGYLFEEKNSVIGGRTGYADVFRRGAFAWENKAPGKNLDAALKQLLSYSLALSNPPILVVCDRLTIRIHTQFTGHPTETHSVLLAELAQPAKLALLRRIWTAPESFRPQKTSRDITELAARSFATLAEGLRKRGPDPVADPQGWQTHADDVAHFLTQCLFCFFAEDVGLLPGRMFEGLVNNRKLTSDKLTGGLRNLFTVMRDGGLYGNDDIPWFNGGLFQNISIPALSVLEMTELRNAASLNWSAIDVSIFGTLFERGLDPSKRSQLGAHYTDPATIGRIIEPVLARPLLQIWQQLAPVLQAHLAKSTKKGDKHYKAAQVKFIGWLDLLKNYRVLDPACGSGNFLFLGLKALKDIEHQSHIEAATLGLEREADLVTGPHNMLGIELNEYAAELARVTVWIGELQWRLLHGYEFKTNPVLEPLDHIECRDALLAFDPARAAPAEAAWPQANVVIGNPPFLGDKKMRSELGDVYTEALRKVFAGRVPGGADLVTYWFEKARAQIENTGLVASGFVSTQSIRAGANRAVLKRIVETTHIFEAWGDEKWVNDGAAVRVSLVCFGAVEDTAHLNGHSVSRIHADLSGGEALDLTAAESLLENTGVAFQGPVKVGSFDIPGELARRWLRHPNVNGKSNANVLRPWANGQDIARRATDTWIIDFGVGMTERDASEFELPFERIRLLVKPMREAGNREGRKRFWWLHGETAPSFRLQVSPLQRYLVTPRVAKHRFFAWLQERVWPDSRLYAVARADDASFGVLSSRIHEVWSLAQASMHGVGNDPTYNAKSCFETFPFPEGLTPADTAHQRTESVEGGALIPAGLSVPNKPPAHKGRAQPAIQTIATATRDHATRIAIAAKRLSDLREHWLNPPEWTQRLPEVIPLGLDASPYPDRIVPKNGHEQELAARTLTQLYNQRPAWLDAAHQTLDAAVAAAYGWADYDTDMPDEEILKRLLALNRERAAV